MSKQPKKVVEAFSACGAVVGKVQLRDFTMSSLLIMQKLNCPLIAGNGKMTDMDIMRLVFVLAHPPATSFRLLSQNTETFDESVIIFGESIALSDLPKLGLAINKLFTRAMSTAPSSSAPGKKKMEEHIHLQTSRPEAAVSAGS